MAILLDAPHAEEWKERCHHRRYLEFFFSRDLQKRSFDLLDNVPAFDSDGVADFIPLWCRE